MPYIRSKSTTTGNDVGFVNVADTTPLFTVNDTMISWFEPVLYVNVVGYVPCTLNNARPTKAPFTLNEARTVDPE